MLSVVVTCRIFNTNNLWINMPAIERAVTASTLHMEIIVNPKVPPPPRTCCLPSSRLHLFVFKQARKFICFDF